MEKSSSTKELIDLKESNPKDHIGSHKPPMHTIPANVLAEIGVALFEGKCKYGQANWRAVGVRASIYYDATMRHLMAYWEGEDIDPGSGLSHITKAISSLIVFRDALIRDNVTDDRPWKSAPFYAELSKVMEKILEKYGHLKPKHFIESEKDVADV